LEFDKKQILITVKAYPNASVSYGETVCCAGIDLRNYQWIRLYPIPFRDLDNEQQFKKYSIIEANCSRPKDDKRPESFKVIYDSIKILEWLDTDKGTWTKRKSIVLKLPIKSMCQVYKDAEENDLSLALIKPESISFEWTKHTLSRKRNAGYAQLSFFNKRTNALEEIPFDFYYNFGCCEMTGCPRHRLSIIDWEIGQAYRDWRSRYRMENELLEKIKQKWLDIADTSKKDVYLYVGNMKRFRKQFMVLGVFYPPKMNTN
jgi:hypothetical protein